jgi:endonuclease YncB( thermonuclease family)
LTRARRFATKAAPNIELAMNRLSIPAFAAALCIVAGPAVTQENNDAAPAPSAVPIGEVGEEPISPAAGQTIEGMATVIDGDELRIGDSLIRLFGIAAPDISSILGPDARLYLDGLAGGQHVVCIEVDRTMEDQSIAICTIDGTDLAPEMLSQGLASVYRVGAPPTPEERELAARYDTEEADARARKLGVWAPRDAAAAGSPQPTLLQNAVPKWIEQAPLLGLLAVLGIIALVLLARRREAVANGQDPVDDQVLAATFLAEVSAIRDSAQEQYDGTESLIQDLPIPGSHLGLLGLPRATVFSANADRLDLLPLDLAAKLVRFHAMHDGAAHLLQEAATVRCETVRATLQSLTRSADEVLGAR